MMQTLYKLLNYPVSLFEKFHSRTKISKMPQINDDPQSWPEEWKIIYFKGYSRLEEIKLCPPKNSLGVSLENAILNRVSFREFTKKPIECSKISTILYYSAGLNKHKQTFGNARMYPSAGARYPLEIYVLPLNVKGLKKNIYHYYVKSHSLELIGKLETNDIISCFNQEFVSKASCLILLTAVFNRTVIKYGDRGYRYVLIESGHLGQNIYLTSTALGLGVCAIGGFIDKKLEVLLDIDGIKESIVYAFAIGTR